jgi:predicted amidohydrolase YtcJ
VVFTIIWPYMARISALEERAAAMEEAIETYNARGYVGLIDMAMDQDSWDSLLSLKARRPDLPMHIAAYWLIRPADEEDCLKQVDYVTDMASKYNAATSPDLKIVGIKIVCDGIVDACTAALAEPYTHTSSTAELVWTKPMLLPVVKRADEAGLQVALHAIGDLAVHNAIDVIEARVAPERRPRIEHLELASAEDAARLGRLGITASVQAVHADPAILRAWPRLIGEHRCGRAFAYREFADGGAPIALGTDAPTAPQSLPANCYVATTRRSAREPDLQTVVNGHFALGLCESVVAGTEGSARSCFMDNVTGRLEKGMQADLAVVDMVWEKTELLKAEVTQTWFAGRQVFDGRKKT